tara:strand:+ start:5388 stop:5897 length:510 start_codon:yes stop_codon:yes gene_type:complete
MFGDLFDTIGGWIDTGVDYVAEVVGYEDIANVELLDTLTAGEQLTDDVMGFIRKGAGAYLTSQKKVGKVGYQGPTKYAQDRLRPKSGYGSGKSRAGSMTYSPSASGRIGYGNPEIQTALTNLLRSSNNQQLNNMFSSYIVQPNRRGSAATVTVGSPKLKKITSTKLKTT